MKRKRGLTDCEFRGPKMANSKHGKVHILRLWDEVGAFLAPCPPHIHRVLIPSAAAKRECVPDSGCWAHGNPWCHSRSGQCDIGGAELKLSLSGEALKEAGEVFIAGFQKLLEMKFGIMALRIRHGLDAWVLGSHMVNPFEVVSFVAATSVLNRAYFKMWELIQTFHLVPSVAKKPRFLSAHLCEGPGGFIEAIMNYRAQTLTSEGLHRDLETADLSGVVSISEAVSKRFSGSLRAAEPNEQSSDQNSVGQVCRSYSEPVEAAASTLVNGIELGRQPRSSSPFATVKSTEDEPRVTYISNSPQPTNPLWDFSTSKKSLSAREDFQVLEENLDGGGSSKLLDRTEACGEVMLSSSRARDEFLDSLSTCSNLPLPACESNFSDNTLSVKTPEQYNDLWFALTLASDPQCLSSGENPPKMETRRLNRKVAGNSEGHVHCGVDGSGDLTNPANGSAFVDYTLSHSNGERMDLITADGAFDVSDDFCSQEHSHLHLVFCEVVTALRLQAEGGSLVLKLFDCYTACTLTILSILSSVYRDVEIVRLRTTRVCNSERYVVARGFSQLSPELEQTLVRLNLEWSKVSMEGPKVGVMLSGGFPEDLLHAVMESNDAISAVQIDGISRALQVADTLGGSLPPSDSSGRRQGLVSMLRRKLQTQEWMQRNAIALCKELQIPSRSQFSTK